MLIPREVELTVGSSFSFIACGEKHIVAFAPTGVREVTPSSGPVEGGSELTIYVDGVWQCDELLVRFFAMVPMEQDDDDDDDAPLNNESDDEEVKMEEVVSDLLKTDVSAAADTARLIVTMTFAAINNVIDKNIDDKSHHISNIFLNRFCIDFGRICGGFWRPTWYPKSIQFAKICDITNFQKQRFRVELSSKTRFRDFKNR